ncbi:MAG: AbrB/MazE/SpoVT family DNA-binding domain-containing protein [Candidatus Hodarchaeota archaeon]
MKGTIKKWGNSFALRIPKSILDDMNLGDNSEVEILISDGAIELHPVKKKEYTLEELMEGITQENLHHEVETGSPKGNEAW